VFRIKSPSAGFWMEFRWVVLMRGINKPPAVPAMSNNAEASGCWVLMPTCWASREQERNKKSSVGRRFMGLDLRAKVQFAENVG